jgi:hypothetical protein
MTIERLVAVAAPLDDKRTQLIADILSAAGRARYAEPGDRLDVVRHEALSTQLEMWAFAQRGKAGVTDFKLDVHPRQVFFDCSPLPDWVPADEHVNVASIIEGGGVLVAISLPLEVGTRTATTERKQAPPAATPWKATERRTRKDGKSFDAELHGRRAVQKRFRDQLAAALSEQPPKPFYPTGISNRVLSDALREYVNQPAGARRVDVPVEYRDGSRSQHPFPLHALALLDEPEKPHDLFLKMALLSIRHSEMDAVVDGAWLRNAQISQPRPHAQTDDLVYGISCEQFKTLTQDGRRRLKLELYQTGFEPANVGFYRAVVTHLLAHPGSLCVIPQYHQETFDNRPSVNKGTEELRPEFIPGQIWATRRKAD